MRRQVVRVRVLVPNVGVTNNVLVNLKIYVKTAAASN